MAGTRATAGPLRFRQRKLVTKLPLQVLRENELESDEYKDSLANEERLDTGVEKSEESEYHLQQALAAFSGHGNSKDAQNIVPAPPSQASTVINYDQSYNLKFSLPHPYIAFSETVEHTTGCGYDMNTDDDVWLKGYNAKRNSTSQCSENDFERFMEYFENTADTDTPFASVDQTVVPLETMEANIKKSIPDIDKIRFFVKDIYEYWKTRRQCSSNRPLQPSLKFEVHQDADDGDPYVCFRRRDVRQVRKTRNRDVQSVDKLKRIRIESEEGRLLLLEYQQSLIDAQRQTRLNRKIFEKRAKVKDVRFKLVIKCDDEDLVNQKPQKKKVIDVASLQRAQQAARQPVHQPNGRPLESELVQIEDYLREREENIQKAIDDNRLGHHQRSNKMYNDYTKQPLSDVSTNTEPKFRVAHTQMPMTPPASHDDDVDERGTPSSAAVETNQKRSFANAFGTTERESSEAEVTQPSYRRRIGRMGRLWIDRRGMKPSHPENPSKAYLDRWKYDSDSDEEPPIYEIDPYSTDRLNFRANIQIMARPGTQPNYQGSAQRAIMGSGQTHAAQAAPSTANPVARPAQATSSAKTTIQPQAT